MIKFKYSDQLAAIIDNHRVMEDGCPYKKKIRIGTVAAGEMIVAAARRGGMEVAALQLDYWLWRTGFDVLDRSSHHRVVTTDY